MCAVKPNTVSVARTSQTHLHVECADQLAVDWTELAKPTDDEDCGLYERWTTLCFRPTYRLRLIALGTPLRKLYFKT